MSTSFIAALGGMRANQSWIDIIGNNLANANTPGFKGSRALFADLFSITIRPGTPPTGALGGTNPLQQGLGVQLARSTGCSSRARSTRPGAPSTSPCRGAGCSR